MRRCSYCGKELDLKEGKRKLNPRRRFCNHTCNTRYNSLKRHNQFKDNKKFKAKARKRFKGWYKKNKDNQNKNLLSYYYKNKGQWRERGFVQEHRKRIMQFINPLCSCGKKTKIIFHKKYGAVPKLSRGKGNEEEKLGLIKRYTKENLVGVCSQLCLQKEKSKRNRNERR